MALCEFESTHKSREKNKTIGYDTQRQGVPLNVRTNYSGRIDGASSLQVLGRRNELECLRMNLGGNS